MLFKKIWGTDRAQMIDTSCLSLISKVTIQNLCWIVWYDRGKEKWQKQRKYWKSHSENNLLFTEEGWILMPLPILYFHCFCLKHHWNKNKTFTCISLNFKHVETRQTRPVIQARRNGGNSGNGRRFRIEDLGCRDFLPFPLLFCFSLPNRIIGNQLKEKDYIYTLIYMAVVDT